MPNRRPISTILECTPWVSASQLMSLHHWTLISINLSKEIKTNPQSFLWKASISPDVKPKDAIDLKRGHGDSSTKW